MQTEEALIRLHECLSLQLAYVDSYNVTMYIFSYSDHDSLNYWNGGQ